ncbi:MAG: hypothetical protein PUC95_05395, partial [Gemmiger formicilis]|nr:hypothetical protein [Gemmiger formicilis]
CRFKAAVFFNSNAKPRVMQEVWGIFEKKEYLCRGEAADCDLRQYRIILSADTTSEVRQLLSQKRR